MNQQPNQPQQPIQNQTPSRQPEAQQQPQAPQDQTTPQGQTPPQGQATPQGQAPQPGPDDPEYYMSIRDFCTTMNLESDAWMRVAVGLPADKTYEKGVLTLLIRLLSCSNTNVGQTDSIKGEVQQLRTEVRQLTAEVQRLENITASLPRYIA